MLGLLRFVTFTLCMMLVAASHAQKLQDRIHTTNDGDYPGFDLTTHKEISIDQCKALCLGSIPCAAFTYNVKAQFCFLKSDFGTLKPYTGAIAGKVVRANNGRPSAELDIGAAPELSFVHSSYFENARKFRERLAAGKPIEAAPGFFASRDLARQKLVEGDLKAALENYNRAVRSDPENVTIWLELSSIALAASQGANGNDRDYYLNIGMPAAVTSYTLSRDHVSRARALEMLALGLVEQKRHRAALAAYTQSLALDDVITVRADYSALRKKHGFRVTGHTVDSDAATPRVCVQFSEKLGKKDNDTSIDKQLENFVRINNSTPQAIAISGQQLCVEGLEHGGNYTVVLRKGLPSILDEVLENDVSLTMDVHDRKPLMRFTNNNFVVPLSARQGIPLVSVNATSAQLEVYRVGERALSQLLSSGQFLKQLDSYDKEHLLGNIGQPVWEGELTIKQHLNKEVTTSIPIDDVLKQRQPGVYLVTANLNSSNSDNRQEEVTQWFVISDIGLTTFGGYDNERAEGKGELRVFTRSLTNAKPLPEVTVTLMARNNQVLGSGVTDAKGEAVFGAGLMRGKGGMAPKFISAKRGSGDFVLLDLSTPGFDFSDRGVTGRAAPKGIDVYAWTERGIYRAGETVNVSALARDPVVKAIDDLPLTFVFYRPDGVEERRIVDDGATLGGYAVELPLTGNAPRGTWSLQVFADPKSNPIAKERFLVEDFLPERTDFSLKPRQNQIALGGTVQVDVNGKYLYGPPAAGLELESELVISASNTRDAFSGYKFGLAGESGSANQVIQTPTPSPLNENGESIVHVALGETRATTRPQTANLVVRMRETSGRAVERRVTLNVTAPTVMIGVKPNFEEGQVEQNSTASFNVIAVDPHDNRTALADVKWSLKKIDRNYQWYRNGSRWNYEIIEMETQLSDGVISLDAQAPFEIKTPVDWGKYRLDVESSVANGPATSVEFYAGWYVENKSADTPDALEIGLDKSSYKTGEVAQLTISPRFAGELLVAIGTDKIVETHMVSVPAEGKTISLPVGENWGAGAYVLATLYRPGDTAKSRLPMRAIGVKWLAVDQGNKVLDVKLGTAPQARPDEPFKIPVSITNLPPGQEAYVSVAVVDVGILNLTSHSPPDPEDHYLSQRKFGVGMRDIYGKLIDSSSGVTGKLRTGGDGGEEGMSSSGSAPTQKLLSLVSAPIRVDEDGNGEVTFDLPSFNGSVRIMAVAWSAEGVGSTSAESVIRDPIVISASLPKFMASGDHSRLLLEVTNTDAPAGDYDLTIEASENLQLSLDNIPATLKLEQQKKQTLSVPIVAQDSGTATVIARLNGSDGSVYEKEIAIAIRLDAMPVTQRIEVSLPPNGGTLKVDDELLIGNRLDGAKINISVSRSTAIDVDSLLMQLDRYPYGCAEQVTSKALPLLYAKDFSTPLSPLNDVDLKPGIDKAIHTVLAYQSSSGGFSLWGSSKDDLWLSAYVTDFLTRAAEKGFEVPGKGMQSALQNLQNTLGYKADLASNGEAVAYALYVLARNRKASAGDLRYFAESRLQEFSSPLARSHLAAGLALYGDQQRSVQTFNSAFQLMDHKTGTNASSYASNAVYSYGSHLRDASAMLALATEAGSVPTDRASIMKLIDKLRSDKKFTSTQEQAWMLLAARAQEDANKSMSLLVNGETHKGVYGRQLTGRELGSNPISLTNHNAEAAKVVVTAIAVPSEPKAAGGTGFIINRLYYRLDGTPANVSEVQQNERFVVVIKAQQLSNRTSRVVITDLLPAGFEIDNPRLVDSAKNKKFSWLSTSPAEHWEFRDDRFVAAYDSAKNSSTKFTIAYTVRAVTLGTYAHPAAQVEDMYRPDQAARTAFGWMKVHAAK